MPAPASITLREEYDVLQTNNVGNLTFNETAANSGEEYRVLGCIESRASSRMQSYNETEASQIRDYYGCRFRFWSRLLLDQWYGI